MNIDKQMTTLPNECSIVLRIDISKHRERIDNYDRYDPFQKWQDRVLFEIPNAQMLEIAHGTVEVDFEGDFPEGIPRVVAEALAIVATITEECCAAAQTELDEIEKEDA